jgi:GT2 family glycosyltransferase
VPKEQHPGSVLTVVVHYRGEEATRRCLEAVRAQVLDTARMEILVVDNSGISTDWGVPRLDAGGNQGFAGGSNLGIRHAAERGFDQVWLINPDAAADGGALQALVSAMQQDARLAAVGSDLGEGPPGGRVALWQGRAIESRTGPWEFISGASMLLRLSAIKEVGGFDEALFLYWEDVDLCLRLRRAGWRVTVEPRSRVGHEGGGAVGRASPTQDYYATRNALLVVWRHARVFLPLAAVCVLLRVTLAKALRREWKRLRAAWRGWKDGVLNRGGPLGDDPAAARDR